MYLIGNDATNTVCIYHAHEDINMDYRNIYPKYERFQPLLPLMLIIQVKMLPKIHLVDQFRLAVTTFLSVTVNLTYAHSPVIQRLQ